MLKQVVYPLVFVTLLLGLLLVVERTSSPSFQSCLNDQLNSKTNAATKEQPSTPVSYLRCTSRFVEGHGSAITALATVIIALFTYTLWTATSQQAQLAREAFIADKRAFVFASGVRGIYEPNPASGHFNWRVGPIWQNSGDTPTRGLRLYSDGFLSNVPISPNFDFNQVDPAALPGPGMLGPKQATLAGQAPHLQFPALTPQDISDIQNGRRFFYLWGWATYQDILPGTPQRNTRYCWRILVTGDPFTFDPNVNPNSVTFFNLYEFRGNCADEECVHQGLV